MGFLAGLVNPILPFLALGVEIAVFQHRQLMLSADLIGDFTQLLVVADFVFELCTVLEGHRIHNKMAVNIVGVQVDGNEHLIPVAPHPPCGFLANGECLLRRDLSLFEALDAVVAHHWGIGGCAPKESADFGCDWDFCGTQSPCLLYRETHPTGAALTTAFRRQEQPSFPSGRIFSRSLLGSAFTVK